MIAEQKVYFEARRRPPVGEPFARLVVAMCDELVKEQSLERFAKFGCSSPEVALLQRRDDADVKEVVLGRADWLAAFGFLPGRQLVQQERIAEDRNDDFIVD